MTIDIKEKFLDIGNKILLLIPERFIDQIRDEAIYDIMRAIVMCNVTSLQL